MTPPSAKPYSSTPRDATGGAAPRIAPAGEEDFAIGCECADPALQIEGWLVETRCSSSTEHQLVTAPVLQAVPA